MSSRIIDITEAGRGPFSIIIHRDSAVQFCLVEVLPCWCRVRRSNSGSHFCLADGSAVKTEVFMHLSMLSRWGGRPGKGGGFDSNHRPLVEFFDRFNGLSSNILLTFSCYFDNPQCPGVGHLNGNSQLSSNAPPMPAPHLPAA